MGRIASDAARVLAICAAGALDKAGSLDSQVARDCLRQEIDHANISVWNDRQTSKKPVLAAFDRAIKKLEEQGSVTRIPTGLTAVAGK